MRSKHIQQILTFAIAVFLVTLSSLGLQRGADPETRFRDAQRTQQVEGNPSAAIEIYREIAASANASPALKAKALLGLARSMETLGQQAETVYERIAREFTNQPEAAQARARLAVLKPPPPPETTFTPITFGAGIEDVVATDGKRVVYWDKDGTTLFIGDKDGRAKTQIFTTTKERRPRAEVARDLSMVFLYFNPSPLKPGYSYAVIRTDGSGSYHEVDLPESGSLLFYSVTWSFDNRYILLCKAGTSRTAHPLKLSLEDGKIVDLLAGDSAYIIYASPSPDNRSIALQDLNQTVYVMPAQGGKLETIASAGAVVDWTLDGQLVFGATEENGLSLFTIPVRDGRPTGEQTFIRRLPLRQISRPITSGTSLIFAQEVGKDHGPQMYHASLNHEGHLSEWTHLQTIGPGASFPTISPDGKRFAYVSRSADDQTVAVRLYTFAADIPDKELFRSPANIGNCIWAAQPPVLYCGQIRNTEVKTAILSIDVATGRAETIKVFPGIRLLEYLSPDQRILRMTNLTGANLFPRWEIGADEEIPGPQGDPGYPSSDGRWALTFGVDAAKYPEIRIRQGSGGDAGWEHLVSLKKQAPDTLGPMAVKYTADSNWVVYHDLDSNEKDALFRVKTTGGEPELLGSYPTSQPNSYLAISPDARQFLAEVSPDKPTSVRGLELEYWMLQNFLPSSASATPKR